MKPATQLHIAQTIMILGLLGIYSSIVITLGNTVILFLILAVLGATAALFIQFVLDKEGA